MLVIDGYVRTMRSNGGGANSIQRAQIRRWIAGHGWQIGRIFEESVGGMAEPSLVAVPAGGSAELPPLLRAALDRVESRESDGIVTPRLAHLGGSLTEALHTIERVRAAGGRFVSVGERFDASTPSGRLMLRLLLSIGDW